MTIQGFVFVSLLGPPKRIADIAPLYMVLRNCRKAYSYHPPERLNTFGIWSFGNSTSNTNNWIILGDFANFSRTLKTFWQPPLLGRLRLSCWICYAAHNRITLSILSTPTICFQKLDSISRN